MVYLRMFRRDYRWARKSRSRTRALGYAIRVGWSDFAFYNLPRRFWS